MTVPTFEIREANPNDLIAWSQLRTRLWPDSSDNHVAELNDYFSGQSVDIVQAFVIEVVADQPIGFIELNLRNFAEGSRQSQIPYVEGWLIDSEFQGRGLGQALMRRAEQWALQLGFDELASDTEIDNERSAAIHQHLGFDEVERVICFLKKLR